MTQQWQKRKKNGKKKRGTNNCKWNGKKAKNKLIKYSIWRKRGEKRNGKKH